MSIVGNFSSCNFSIIKAINANEAEKLQNRKRESKINDTSCCPDLFQIKAMINIMSTDKCFHIGKILAQGPNSSIVCTRSI